MIYKFSEAGLQAGEVALSKFTAREIQRNANQVVAEIVDAVWTEQKRILEAAPGDWPNHRIESSAEFEARQPA